MFECFIQIGGEEDPVHLVKRLYDTVHVPLIIKPVSLQVVVAVFRSMEVIQFCRVCIYTNTHIQTPGHFTNSSNMRAQRLPS